MRNVWTPLGRLLLFGLCLLSITFNAPLKKRRQIIDFSFCNQMFGWILSDFKEPSWVHRKLVCEKKRRKGRNSSSASLNSTCFLSIEHYFYRHLSPLICDVKTFYLRRSKVKPFSALRNWIWNEWNGSMILQKVLQKTKVYFYHALLLSIDMKSSQVY